MVRPGWRMVRFCVNESVQQSFVDPEPLYASGVDLGVRVDVFGQHLRLDSGSLSRLQGIYDALAARTPILDVGCGLGETLLPVGPTFFDNDSVVGRDLSFRQLRSIVERCGSASAVRVARFDAARLPYRSRSIAAVLARHMLYHVPDPRVAAAEAARVLTADGMLLPPPTAPTAAPSYRTRTGRPSTCSEARTWPGCRATSTPRRRGQAGRELRRHRDSAVVGPARLR